MTTLDSFLQELEASIEQADPGSITADTRFRDLEWWDSLAALSTLAVVDGCYGRQLSAEQLANCNTFGDIHALVSQ